MKLLFERKAVRCRTDDSQLFEETQIRVSCFGTLDWWRGHQVGASIFAGQHIIFFCAGSLNPPALKIPIFNARCLRRLTQIIRSIFCVGRLKQLTLKMSIFSTGCVRQPAQKMKSYFWYRFELLTITIKKLRVTINHFSSSYYNKNKDCAIIPLHVRT
jgi:hypothetical protein